MCVIIFDKQACTAHFFSLSSGLLPCVAQVQENCIDLVGRIADRGAEYVPAREWMRICFELLEMLKAHKKGIRRATVNTFGYIAKAIGPQARPWLFRLCAAHAWYAVAGAL